MTIDDFMYDFNEVVEKHHGWLDTLSCEQNFNTAMKDFEDYATHSRMSHFLDSEVFIAHYNSILKMAKERDAEIAIMLNKIRPTK